MEEKDRFYMIPKFIFSEEYRLSSGAKLLYALLLDRKKLSEINRERFTDGDGRLFVTFKYSNAADVLGCSRETVAKYIDELCDRKLIETAKYGGRGSRFYIGDRDKEREKYAKKSDISCEKSRHQMSENFTSDVEKSDSYNNNTKYNKNKYSNIYTRTQKENERSPKPSYDLDKYTRRAFQNPMKIFENEKQ